MESVKRTMSTAAGMVKPSSDQAAGEVGRPSAPDAVWAAMMIPHHHTGIEMAELAMEQAATEDLRQAAAASKAEQEEDLPRLHLIIDAAGQTATPPEPQIEQMNQTHMQMLRSMSGTEFDRHWITVVNGHHMSAIMMTDVALSGTAGGGAKELQEKLRGDQLQEIGHLNRLIQQLS